MAQQDSATARVFFTDSESDADLYYLTHFLAGDPIVYFESGGKRELFLNDLEVDRGRKQSNVDDVHRLKDIADRVEERTGQRPGRGPVGAAACIGEIARERGVRYLDVSARCPIALADALRADGFGVAWKPDPFVPERALKTADEVEKIRGAVRHTEAAMTAAIERIGAAEIRDGGLYEGETTLTSEEVKRTINRTLMELGCHPYEAIVAGGDQGCDPHDRGSGPLPANLPIIIDIFPRDLTTRYHGDMTRTVVRGKASDEAKAVFEAVAAAKAAAIAKMRAGVSGRDVHAECNRVFDERGYKTEQRDGRMVGFFHGTGHGLGLAVHEYPGVGQADHKLGAGHVVTVEPGLYYPGIGGVRIEDDVLVTEDGCENLCQLETVFEI